MFRAYDIIDPVNLTLEDSRYLGRILLKIHAETGEVYFPAGASTHILGKYSEERVTLNLTHPVVIRHSRHRKDLLRIEVIGKEIGRGGFSHVYKIIHTLIPQNDGSLVSKDKHRVVKVQQECASDHVTAAKEYRHAALTPHLHVKRPVYSALAPNKRSFMVGGFMFGSSLEHFLKVDARSRKFSLEERLRLSVELIRALREQVHALGIVHRDIKPGNIIVKAGDGKFPHSFIIDFGLSKNASIDDRVRCGTYRYFAPEIWKSENATHATDIYSLGVVLSQLWGAPLPTVMTYEASLNRQFEGMFTNIYGLSAAQKDALKNVMKKMCANLQHDRATLDEAEAVFNQVRFELSMNIEDEKSRQMLETIRGLARVLRQEIHKYCQNNGDKWHINVVRREIEKGMTHFPDKPVFVREFISELGIQALDDLTDKASIRAKMKAVTADFVFAREDFGIVAAALSAQITKGLSDFDADYQEYLQQTLANCQRRNNLIPRSVDEVVMLTEKSRHDTDKIKKEIEFIHQSRIQSNEIKVPVRPLVGSKLPAKYEGFFREQPRIDVLPVLSERDMPLRSAFSPFARY